MKIRLCDLRRIIREEFLAEYGQAASASGSDPTDAKGFYPYEVERGTDIHGYWYRSPGRASGSEGDPSRPADAGSYIGLTPPKSDSGDETSSSGEAGADLATTPKKESFRRR